MGGLAAYIKAMDNHSPDPSEKARADILAAVLMHVPFDGWTRKTLTTGLRDTDLPPGAEELYFPGGPLELISYWSEAGDNEALAKIEARGLDNLRIREKVTECVWIRLNEMTGQEQAARRAISRLSLPDAIGQGPQQLWKSANMIWRAIGDTSTDGNYYSKRTILSGVIGSSIMAWLSDESDDKAKARAFLEARIDNVMQFEKAKFAMRKRREKMPDPAGLLGRLRYGRRRRKYR